jgi:hypothetical protein
MKPFLLLPLLILLISQRLDAQEIAPNDSSVAVLGSKWTKYRRKLEKPEVQTAVRAQPLSNRANRTFERSRRVNDPVGTPDPNAETIEGRSATLEKNVQESRSPKSGAVDGFLYQVNIRNDAPKTIEIIFWEYQFKERSNSANTSSRQFLCGVKIKPEKEKQLSVFSASGPSSLISVDSLAADKSENLFEEKILINRIEYADGTIWQRQDWNYAQIKPALARALETPWGSEMCRGL